jgi:hypothetical protein
MMHSGMFAYSFCLSAILYFQLVHDLFGGNAGDDEDNVPEAAKQENIRRRVYDALNVLHAIDIIKFENKDICWVGAERSAEVRRVTESQTAMARAQDPPEDGEDEESEEPEYDDMDIEELQVTFSNLCAVFFRGTRTLCLILSISINNSAKWML